MFKNSLIAGSIVLAAVASSCSSEKDFVKDDFDVAEKQYTIMLDQQTDLTSFPRTVDAEGKVVGTDIWDWTQGFFPGALWYVYEHNQDPKWKAEAEKWTEALEEAKFLTQHHDIGFVMFCSYGNAVRLEKDTAKINRYNKILIQSAESALTRYYDNVGVIKSWNDKMSWDGKTIWKYPVIIDNMMNLDLLFYVSKLTGDPKYRNVAISHADVTMKNHFRDDYSSYHVVDYDAATGEVLHQQTNQGYSDNSTWSRGQAWAIYGYTLMYRETKDPKYLEHAKKVSDFFIDHPNLPKDKIPYWDFNVEQEGYTPDWDYKGQNKLNYIPRDASAAAIATSGLLELSTFLEGAEKQKYFGAAEEMLKSLSSKEYLAEPGTNSGFILKHSVGSFPHSNEIDVPLIYADYYFLEALLRYKNIKG